MNKNNFVIDFSLYDMYKMKLLSNEAYRDTAFSAGVEEFYLIETNAKTVHPVKNY